MVSKNRIGNHAMNLLAGVASYREEDDTVCPNYDRGRTRSSQQQDTRPIIFICHSLGGLVCEDVSYPAERLADCSC